MWFGKPRNYPQWIHSKIFVLISKDKWKGYLEIKKPLNLVYFQSSRSVLKCYKNLVFASCHQREVKFLLNKTKQNVVQMLMRRANCIFPWVISVSIIHELLTDYMTFLTDSFQSFYLQVWCALVEKRIRRKAHQGKV